MHKLLVIGIGLVLSGLVHAVDSGEVRHQLLLKQAAMKQCQVTKAYSEWVLLSTKQIQIDQGVIDYDFVSEIRLVDVISQAEYRVQINSNYRSTYDHTAQEWGQFSIDSVSPCIQVPMQNLDI